MEKEGFTIRPHPGGGLGIDTTRLFKLLPPEMQYGHGVKITPMKPNDRNYSDSNRAIRQQDLIVSGISYLTDRRWRADISSDGTITLSVNKMPKSVREKQQSKIDSDLKLLKTLITN